MYLKIVVVLFMFCCSSSLLAQSDSPYEKIREGWVDAGALPEVEAAEAQSSLVDVAAETPFAKAVAKAARKMRREGKITRLQQIRLRVAMLSPAFRQHAQELAIIQMAYSGADVPMTEDGKIDIASINFEGLLDFIERLIPLIMRLMEIFSQIQ